MLVIHSLFREAWRIFVYADTDRNVIVYINHTHAASKLRRAKMGIMLYTAIATTNKETLRELKADRVAPDHTERMHWLVRSYASNICHYSHFRTTWVM